VVCNLSFFVKNEVVLKVTDSHVHYKSGSVLKTVLDKDVETNSPQTGSDMSYSHIIATTVMSLGVCEGHGCKLVFYTLTDKRVVQSLCHSRTSCFKLQ